MSDLSLPTVTIPAADLITMSNEDFADYLRTAAPRNRKRTFQEARWHRESLVNERDRRRGGHVQDLNAKIAKLDARIEALGERLA